MREFSWLRSEAFYPTLFIFIFWPLFRVGEIPAQKSTSPSPPPPKSNPGGSPKQEKTSEFMLGNIRFG